MSWDDGKHKKVNKVQLTFDDVIRSIEVEYEGTNLQSQRRGSAGTKSDGFTLSSDEYITNVSGYYKTTFSGDVITALTFKTNKKTYGPYGNKTSNYFSADAPSNNQIAGFLGTSGNALSSIDVHFAPIPPPGSIKPKPVDPGTGSGGGSKPVDPGTGSSGGSKPVDPGTGSGGGSKPVDPGTGSGGGSKPVDPGTGSEGGSKPVDPGTGSGGGSKPVDPGTGSGGDSKPVVPGKTGPLGGDKGNDFNDVGFEGVKKITIGADEYSVTYIKIEYIKDGKVVVREHGTIRGELKEFSVDYPNENIVAVGGTYNHIYTYDTTLITSLYFTTSKGFTSPLFGKTNTKATDFEFKGENGGKLLGFHGRGGNAIDAIGAYFDTDSQGGKGGDSSKGGSTIDGPGKKGPLGGDKGKDFNDIGFEGVKKITVGADEYSVTYIKIEYVKDGKVEIREHGTSRGELKEFSVDYPKENITAVGGSYNHIFTYDTTLITSLYFTTSKGFTSPLFGKRTTKATDFEFKGENGGKLLGFHGRGGNAIDAIGAYFDTTGSQEGEGGGPSKGGDPKPDVPGKKGPLGGDSGEEFNDVGFEGVKKITVGADDLSITYIKIEYVKDGKVETREHGTARGELKEFLVDYPKDNIVAVGGSYKHNFTYDTTLITSLYFTTSKGYTSPLFGKTTPKATDFEFKGDNGGKLLGFHGRGGNAIDAIGAYFDTGSKPVGPDSGDNSNSGSGSSTQKLDAQGGKGGNPWDDGGDQEGVTKIHVAVGRAIEQIRFDYIKNGQTKEGPAHGVKGARSSIKTFEISHPDEYLLSVKGWSDSSNKIVGIQFITNTKTSDYYGFEKYPDDEGTDISLEVKDKKIVGFHGFAGTQLVSLGAYFAPIKSTPLKPSKKLKAVGGDEGASWDDGVFDNVKKIQVGQNNDGVCFVAIEYENGSQKVLGDGHGKKSALGVEKFELTYPGEYITSVGVYYDKVQIERRGVTLVTCLKFKTNKQESDPFGMSGGEYAELKEEGHKIVGFHGKAGDWIHQIGVHVVPI